MPTRKLYNRFHVGKNGIRVGDFQKGVANRLPLFQNLSNHTNRSSMGNDNRKIKHYLKKIRALKKKTCSKFSKVYYLQIGIHYYTFCYYHCYYYC